MFFTHVYSFKYVFNSVVIKLSWHILCYLISKNLYLLQNVQSFIFQLICMQLYKCLNFSLKLTTNNQYCLNFIFFFTNFFFLNMVRVRVGSSGQQIRFGSGIFWVGSGQKILTRFAMSSSK